VTEEKFASLVGSRLKSARQALGLSQAALAETAGVSREQWGIYERGGSAPGSEVLAGAAKAGIDVRYVITGTRDYEPPKALTAEEQTLLSLWRSASSDTRKATLGALVGARPSARTAVLIKGNVGQAIEGSQINHFGPGAGPQFVVGGKRRR
jgi:transcriptional regulator with XRE-family HTH domain